MDLSGPIHDFLLVFLGLVLILGSLGVILFPNPISSAFSLGLVFVCISFFYILSNSHFVAAAQLLIYVGAINVLIIFAVMFMNDSEYYKDFHLWTVGDGITSMVCTRRNSATTNSHRSGHRLHHMANKHTIILMQTSQSRATRTFMDYDSISQAMDGICGLYERKLKELNPAIRNITYDIADLYNFIDGLADMSALVYDHSIQAYLPCDRQWIKQRTFQHLKKLAH